VAKPQGDGIESGEVQAQQLTLAIRGAPYISLDVVEEAT
jgi:hypothetical protein